MSAETAPPIVSPASRQPATDTAAATERPLRIAIDILHPAHVHFFRNFYFAMRERGHELLVTAREKDRATELLDHYGIPFMRLSTAARGGVRQAVEFGVRTARFIHAARRFRADVLAGIMGPTIAVAGKVLRRPAWVFYDTEFARATNRWVYPLARKVITPECYQGTVGRNHVTYPGYHELAYLHPNRFTPDVERVRAAGVDPDTPFTVVRFVGWWATHDRGEIGLTSDQKIRAVRELQQFGPVVISSESDVPAELQPHVYRGAVEDIHHVLACASLYVGESATMASECAVLGTPAVYVATTGRGYTDDQAKLGLVHDCRHTQFDHALDRALQLLAHRNDTTDAAAQARKELLATRIDVTSYMIDLFEREVGQRRHPDS